MLRSVMESNIMSQGNTVRLHRVFATRPEKVFRAFLDAEAMAKWLPPYGFTCKVHHFEPKVGGTFRMSFSNFSTNTGHSFGGEYLEIVPNERIRYTDRFDDPNLPGVIEVTVTLKAVSCGTEINIEQANLPTVIPVESCYLGWQQSLAQLALLVEPDIPGQHLPRRNLMGFARALPILRTLVPPQCPTSPVMTSPNNSHASPLNFINCICSI